MNYCKRCLYPENHPLNIVFDEQGVCSGCRVHEEKDSFDWQERGQILKNLLSDYKSKNRKRYDCVVPLSGGRDSYFILNLVKNVYGLNPLVVGYNRHFNTERGLRNWAYLKTHFNCDVTEMVVAPQKVKKITLETLRLRGSMYWHVLAGETVFPVQVAVRFKIPLIIWGHHQGLDQVGMFSHADEVEMTRKYRKEHDLMGLEAENLLEQSSLTENDVLPYVYPHDREIEKTGVRGIYLGNYHRWDTKAQHEQMIQKFGYETADLQRTFDRYNDVHCLHYAGLHDYIKFLKYGYGKVTDHASREIRLKRLTREEGIELVKKYQNIKPKDVETYCSWLGISSSELFQMVEKHRDPRALSDSIINHANDKGVDAVRLQKKSDCQFVLTSSKNPQAQEDKSILLHKGFVHV